MKPLSGWTDPDLGTALGLPEASPTDTGSSKVPGSTTVPSNTGSSETTSKNIPIIAGTVGGVVVIAGIANVFLLVHRHKKNANKTDGAAGGAGGVAPSEPPPPAMTTYNPHHSMVYPPSTPGFFWDPRSGAYYPLALPGAGGLKPPEQSPITEIPTGEPQELSIRQH